MDTCLTVEKIISETTRMGKLDLSERYSALQAFCNEYRYDDGAIINFFRKTPYTAKHALIACGMYLKYGVIAYKTIKALFPINSGKVYSSWDDFMIDQADRICYVFPHTSPYIMHNGRETFEEYKERKSRRDLGVKSKFDSFIEDIEEICDDDLYVEIMCRIVRSEYQPYLGMDKANYIIDYDYMRRRGYQISKTSFGAHRYIELLKCLAEYSIMDAFQAWGDFYYQFESLYNNSSNTSIPYTGKIYEVFVHGKNKSELESNQRDLEKMIYNHGWDCLHHAFEVDSKRDRCVEWIYRALSDNDKKKADYAVERIINSKGIIKNKVNKKPSVLATDKELNEIVSILKEDFPTGFDAWLVVLHRMMSTEKVSKEMSRKCIDKVLWDISNYEQFDQNGMDILQIDDAKILKYRVPKIYNAMINDKTILDYYFRNFQMITCAVDLARIPIILNDVEYFSKIISCVKENGRRGIQVGEFVNRIFSYIYEPFTSIDTYLTRTIERFEADRTGVYDKIRDFSSGYSIQEDYYRFEYSYEEIMNYIKLDSGQNWKEEMEMKYDSIIQQLSRVVNRIDQLERKMKRESIC